MQKRSVRIVNKLGLHARASARLTQAAAQFASAVWIARGARRVNGKSIMGVMMLAAGMGTTVEIETDGEDEVAALEALARLFAERFGEPE